MITLIFSKENSVQQAVFDCYKSLYFDQSQSVNEKTKNLINLLKDATLTDITCIEELMKKCIQQDVFEAEVYNAMWRYYTKPNRNWAKGALTQE